MAGPALTGTQGAVWSSPLTAPASVGALGGKVVPAIRHGLPAGVLDSTTGPHVPSTADLPVLGPIVRTPRLQYVASCY